MLNKFTETISNEGENSINSGPAGHQEASALFFSIILVGTDKWHDHWNSICY